MDRLRLKDRWMRWTDKLTDWQMDWMDWQTQTDRQTDWQMDRQIDRLTDGQKKIAKHCFIHARQAQWLFLQNILCLCFPLKNPGQSGVGSGSTVEWNVSTVSNVSPLGENPSCLQATEASLTSQLSSHTVPHRPPTQISTLPSREEVPPTRRRSPWLHVALGTAEEGVILVQTFGEPSCKSLHFLHPLVIPYANRLHLSSLWGT